ncbi:HAD family hydrolase [Polyangium mundeleinium]|uniref:HAD family hydrolase n=1 Tax=Polyangium mundeleinium TaxID=2995306 RepID=A0ABT5EPF5_9BACT|nr:HAD family hydrolase [Polyangium mundeleinium]MDC0743713.1 HAD family hydrolase [Polyangium mundeleinium]
MHQSFPTALVDGDARPGREGGRGRPAFEHEATFHVEGLSCRSCARRAEQALRTLPGVRAGSVGFFGEIAQAIYDVRVTSEREIASAMAQRGFTFTAAVGAPPSERARLDAGRFGLVVALLGNLVALASWRPARTPEREIAWVELGFTLLLFAVAGPPLLHRARALARRGVLGTEVVTLSCATLALALGVVAMVFDPSRAGTILEKLTRLGLSLDGLSLAAFEASGAILGCSILGLYAHTALLTRAYRSVTRAALAREARVRRVGGSGVDERVACAMLAPGDRVRLGEGDITPVDIVLESAARVSLPDGRAVDRAGGQIVETGARLLSGEVTGRVARAPCSELAAAADAEVHRAALRIERDARQHTGKSFAHVASLALSVASVSFAGFAFVVHALLGRGPFHPDGYLTAIAVLIGASPAAFVIALPAARTIAVLRARAAGVVVKDPAALEALATATVACFDKTGTVTLGTPRVTRLSWREFPDISILEDVAALEASATHRAGRAIAHHLAVAGVRPGALDEAADVRPDGVVGRSRGALVEVSAARPGDPLPPDAREGASLVCVRRNGTVEAWFELWDPPRLGSEKAFRALFQRGLGCRLLSGDGPDATLALAHRLGVPARGGLGPAEKALHVRDLQQAGARVLHISDGQEDRANRGPADVSLAVAPGALPVAVPAPLVLCDDRLETIAWLVDLARALRATVRQSLLVSVVYNAAVIPLCAAGFLSPLVAAGLALGEALLLCGNAARLLVSPGLPGKAAAPPGLPAAGALAHVRTDRVPLPP